MCPSPNGYVVILAGAGTMFLFFQHNNLNFGGQNNVITAHLSVRMLLSWRRKTGAWPPAKRPFFIRRGDRGQAPKLLTAPASQLRIPPNFREDRSNSEQTPLLAPVPAMLPAITCPAH